MIGLSLLLILVVGGTWLCLSPAANRRMVMVACLISLLCPLIIVTFAMHDIEAGVGVRVEGVLAVPTTPAGVTIGGACPTATINIPTSASIVDAGWCARVSLNTLDSSLSLTPIDGVDAVVQVVGKTWWRRPPRSLVLAGNEVTFASPAFAVAGRELALRRIGKRGAVTWGNSISVLSDKKDIVDVGLLAALRRGLQLCDLRWTSEVPPCGSASLVLLDEGKSLFGTALPLPAPFGTRLLVSIAGTATRGDTVRVTSGDTLRVFAGGTRYDFAVAASAPNPYAPQVRGVVVKTVASWRRSRIPLVGTEMAVAGRRLPSPTAQLLVQDGIAFDPDATSFIARIVPTANGAALVAAGTSYALASSGSAIPVQVAAPKALQSSILISSRESRAASSSNVLLEGTLLIALTVMVGLVALPSGVPLRAPVALVVLGAITLATWRLILAARLASAAPFIERATDRGGSLWTGTLVLILVLSQLHRLGDRFNLLRRQLVRLGMAPAQPSNSPLPKWTLAAAALLLVILLFVAPMSTALGLAIAALLMVVLAIAGSSFAPLDVHQRGWVALTTGGGTAAALLLASRMPLAVGATCAAALAFSGVASRVATRWPLLSWLAWLPSIRLPLLATIGIATLSGMSPAVGTPLSFAIALTMLLMSLHAGRIVAAMSGGRTLASATSNSTPIAPRFLHLAPFAIVALALFAIAIVDVGMALMSAPAFLVGTLIAVDFRQAAWPARILLGGLVGALTVIAISVLMPTVKGLSDQTRPIPERVKLFNGAGGAVAQGLRTAGLETSVDRSIVRRIANLDPVGLEAIAPWANASSAAASIEQTLEHVRGMRQCAERATMFGAGFGRGAAIASGIPVTVLGAESSYSGLVLEEFGVGGGIGVLLVYLMIAVGAMWSISVRGQRAPQGVDAHLRIALLVAVAIWIVGQAGYVAASNVGMATLTGANLPGLAAFSFADALFGAALLALVLMPAITIQEEESYV